MWSWCSSINSTSKRNFILRQYQFRVFSKRHFHSGKDRNRRKKIIRSLLSRHHCLILCTKNPFINTVITFSSSWSVKRSASFLPLTHWQTVLSNNGCQQAFTSPIVDLWNIHYSSDLTAFHLENTTRVTGTNISEENWILSIVQKIGV